MNPILPGSDLVGFGFNCLGKYDLSSVTFQVLQHQNEDAETIRYGKNVYSLPDNLSFIELGGPGTTEVQVFQTLEDAQAYFAAKAGLSASVTSTYGKFAGSVQGGYWQTSNSTEATFYGICRAEWQGYRVLYQSPGSQYLSTSFTSDPTYTALPSTYDPTDPINCAAFYAFFRKWGTHYIQQVVVGGCLNYCVSVNQDYNQTAQGISASISAEYKGVFADAKAQAQADWQQAGQTWASNRSVQISGAGGEPSTLQSVNGLNPAYGDNFHDIYNQWSSTLMNYPGVMDFALGAWSELFSGSQAAALDAALIDYMNSVVYVSAVLQPSPTTTFSSQTSIVAQGKTVTPSNPNAAPASNGNPMAMCQVALFDATWNVLFSQVYYALDDVFSGPNPQAAIWDQIYNDVSIYSKAVNVVFVACGIDCVGNVPTQNFAQWLAGYGGALEAWKQITTAYNATQFYVNYIMVGTAGAASATEKLDGPLNIFNNYGGVQWGQTMETYLVAGIGANVGTSASVSSA